MVYCSSALEARRERTDLCELVPATRRCAVNPPRTRDRAEADGAIPGEVMAVAVHGES